MRKRQRNDNKTNHGEVTPTLFVDKNKLNLIPSSQPTFVREAAHLFDSQ